MEKPYDEYTPHIIYFFEEGRRINFWSKMAALMAFSYTFSKFYKNKYYMSVIFFDFSSHFHLIFLSRFSSWLLPVCLRLAMFYGEIIFIDSPRVSNGFAVPLTFHKSCKLKFSYPFEGWSRSHLSGRGVQLQDKKVRSSSFMQKESLLRKLHFVQMTFSLSNINHQPSRSDDCIIPGKISAWLRSYAIWAQITIWRGVHVVMRFVDRRLC